MPETTTLRATDGRVLGKRGLATRAAVLSAVAKHLETTPWHLASVPALARDAGVSAATFYQYFADLPDAVRALASDAHVASDDGPTGHLRLIADLLDWEDGHLAAVGDE